MAERNPSRAERFIRGFPQFGGLPPTIPEKLPEIGRALVQGPPKTWEYFSSPPEAPPTLAPPDPTAPAGTEIPIPQTSAPSSSLDLPLGEQIDAERANAKMASKLKDTTQDATLHSLELPRVYSFADKLAGLYREFPVDLSTDSVMVKTPSKVGAYSSETTGNLSGLENSLARRAWLEWREEQERARELEQQQQLQDVEKARINPMAMAESQRRKTLADASLAEAQGGLFGERTRQLVKDPRQTAYEESNLRLRDYITQEENWDGKGYGALVRAKAEQMAMELYGIKNPAQLKTPKGIQIVDSLQERALEAFIQEQLPMLLRAAAQAGSYIPGS